MFFNLCAVINILCFLTIFFWWLKYCYLLINNMHPISSCILHKSWILQSGIEWVPERWSRLPTNPPSTNTAVAFTHQHRSPQNAMLREEHMKKRSCVKWKNYMLFISGWKLSNNVAQGTTKINTGLQVICFYQAREE